MSRIFLALIDDVAARCGISPGRAATAMKIVESTHHRWRSRLDSGTPLVNVPGPRKIQTADIAALNTAIDALDHKTHWSGGAPSLWMQHSGNISRRDFYNLVRDRRICMVSARRDGFDEVVWHKAGVVWAMDDTMFAERDASGAQFWIHHLRDIGSHYSFQPMTGPSQPHGFEVAANLEHTFRTNDAPLFLKRDHGKNLNTPDICEVLADYCVIPFNSPIATPTYNGAIERSQGILKAEVKVQLASVPTWSSSTAEPFARAAAHAINHVPLESLQYATACHWNATNKVQYTMNERKKIYETIKRMRDSILITEGQGMPPEVAMRRAVVIWLQQSGLMSINRHRKCHPILEAKCSH